MYLDNEILVKVLHVLDVFKPSELARKIFQCLNPPKRGSKNIQHGPPWKAIH